jgi:hypothetical protein
VLRLSVLTARVPTIEEGPLNLELHIAVHLVHCTMWNNRNNGKNGDCCNSALDLHDIHANNIDIYEFGYQRYNTKEHSMLNFSTVRNTNTFE